MKQSNPEQQKIFGITIGKKAPKPLPVIDPETFTYTPKLPKVNVIPAELTEKYEIKGVARKAVGVAIGVAAVFGLVYAGGLAYTAKLDGDLAALTEQKNTLTTEVVTLSPYEEYKTAVSNKRTTLSKEVAEDVNYGSLYADLSNASNSSNTSFDALSVTQDGEGSCINPDVFSEPENIIGCIQMTGGAGASTDVNVLVDNLLSLQNGDGTSKYVRPFISSVSTGDNGGVTFSATISFTTALYSNQYSELELSIDDMLSTQAAADGENVGEGNIDTVSYVSAVTNQAQTLVPTLTEENLVEIDGISVNACATGDIDTAITSIEEVIIQRLPADDTTINDTLTELETTLTSECGAGE